jgi:hypothetical protein
MVDIDRGLLQALNSRNIKLYVGIPHTQMQLTGTINDSNTDFTIPEEYRGVFCKGGVSITPQPHDVIAYTKKGSTYTEVEVSSINEVTHSTLDIDQYGEITLSSAPTTSGADSVHLTFAEELRPWIAQSIKMGIKQDSTSIGELGENVKVTSYGAQEITIDEDMILGDDLTYIHRLLFEEYDGSFTPESGYDVYTLIAEPQVCYIKVPLEQGSEFVGAYYFEGKIVPTGLGEAKEGDNLSFSLQFSVNESPKLIVPEP